MEADNKRSSARSASLGADAAIKNSHTLVHYSQLLDRSRAGCGEETSFLGILNVLLVPCILFAPLVIVHSFLGVTAAIRCRVSATTPRVRKRVCSYRGIATIVLTALDRGIYLEARKAPPGESAFVAYLHPGRSCALEDPSCTL